MDIYEYLPHEYSYAYSLAYIYDFSSYDSMIFNKKTLDFLHFLLLFFIFISSPSTFNNKNPRKIPEENEENLTFLN